MQPGNPFADAPLPAPGPRLESAGAPSNPYAAPAAVGDETLGAGPGVGIWRHRDLVVIHQALDFPTRCIWTNDEGKHRLSTTVTYSAWFGFGHGSIQFDYSLSNASHRRKRLNEMRSAGLWLAGGGLLFVSFLLSNGGQFAPQMTNTVMSASFVLGLLLLAVRWFLYRRHSHVFFLIHREGPYFALAGAREPFLRSLPRWPGLIAR